MVVDSVDGPPEVTLARVTEALRRYLRDHKADERAHDAERSPAP